MATSVVPQQIPVLKGSRQLTFQGLLGLECSSMIHTGFHSCSDKWQLVLQFIYSSERKAVSAGGRRGMQTKV